MSLSMSRAEREAFLAETRVAVVSVAEEGRGPLTLPVWHIYEPGAQVRFVTGGLSRKAHLIRKAPRLSLCVQTETPPYRYVSVEGPVALGVPDYERDIRPTALRYLGTQLGELYLQATAGDRAGSILITLSPERWLSVDYGKWGG